MYIYIYVSAKYICYILYKYSEDSKLVYLSF